MKLSKLYSNFPEIFEAIEFRDGLNVIIAEIRVPENKNKDTHNLGKTTVGRLLDFCLLSERDPDFFLFKYPDIFGEFIFFLEIELNDASCVTIRRSVSQASKISFKKHLSRNADYSEAALLDWDHYGMPFERAKEMLDGILDWRELKPWSFRNILGYLLRSQDDYQNIFQLKKFAGPHADWKPFLAHLLGFNAGLIQSLYQKEIDLTKLREVELTINNEIGGTIFDSSKIEGILLLKQKEVSKREELLNSFDFRQNDKEDTKKLVDEIDVKIAQLNSERYSLSFNRKKIMTSISDDQILFNPEEARELFAEAGILFEGQIKKDFEQLIAFNKAITEERRIYLEEERQELEERLKLINADLNKFGKRRSQILSILTDTDSFTKYKSISEELVLLRADVISLERQRDSIHRLQELRNQTRLLSDELTQLQSKIEADVEHQNSDPTSLFSKIRIYFNDIVQEVISRMAVLSVTVNRLGHLDFKAEILDDAGKTTSASKGHTYQKLLCIAFDLAVMKSRINGKFPSFVYHDGAFESLDDRKKDNLLMVLRTYGEMGIQPVITLIDSDLPENANEGNAFSDDEIVVTLHDEGMSGRLFKMATW